MITYFKEVYNSIENDDIREFAETIAECIPNYFFQIPASSTQKYHPTYACEVPLGLYKHTLAVVKFINYFFEVESLAEKWTSRERDLVRVAGMMHDTFKSGSQADYEKNKYTKHEHPIIASNAIMKYKGCGIIPDDEILLIAKTIETHMGAWNTSPRSDIVLATPKNKYQKLVHLADYLASRKDIEIKFEELN